MTAKRVLLWIISAVVIVVVAVGIWRFRGKKQDAAAATQDASNRPLPVVVAEAQKKDTPIFLEGLGSVAAFQTVLVKPQVDGRLDHVFFTEGQQVKKGDPLAQIDPRPFQIQLAQAQASFAKDDAALKVAQLDLKRYEALRESNLGTQQQVDDQRATVAQAQAVTETDLATAQSARLNLDFAHITSPLDGVTGVRLVDQGNIVHAADTTGLVLITQLDPIAVFFTLPEDNFPEVSKAVSSGKVQVEALSRDGKTSLGMGDVALIDNQINQQTATIRLKAIFDNKDRQLWPNEFVKARMKLATKPDALTIPEVAVQRGPQGTFVYVVVDSKAQLRPVDVALTQGETAILNSGVAAGEQVVIDGQYQLKPGAPVAIRSPEKPGGSSSASRPRASADKAPKGTMQ